jgi:hypothetical protein
VKAHPDDLGDDGNQKPPIISRRSNCASAPYRRSTKDGSSLLGRILPLPAPGPWFLVPIDLKKSENTSVFVVLD